MLSHESCHAHTLPSIGQGCFGCFVYKYFWMFSFHIPLSRTCISPICGRRGWYARPRGVVVAGSLHWGQPHEATVVKMAPTRPLASISFCLLVLLSQIYNRETRRHGTPCTKTTHSYLFLFLYNDPRKIRRETTVGKFVPNNGRR